MNIAEAEELASLTLRKLPALVAAPLGVQSWSQPPDRLPRNSERASLATHSYTLRKVTGQRGVIK